MAASKTMKALEFFRLAQCIHNPERLIPPPHIVKQLVIREYACKYNLKIFVETGTLRGDMVYAMRPYFEQIYSIELSTRLYRQAKKRFTMTTRTHLANMMVNAARLLLRRTYSIEQLFEKAKSRIKTPRGGGTIQLILGDSGKELGKLIPCIVQPCLFWLDGHFSGGETALGKTFTPVKDELKHILAAKNLTYVILIDDAREFGTALDYPTLDDIGKFVQQTGRPHDVSVKDDIIRIVPAAMGIEDR